MGRIWWVSCLKAALSINHAYFLEGISLGGCSGKGKGLSLPSHLGTGICYAANEQEPRFCPSPENRESWVERGNDSLAGVALVDHQGGCPGGRTTGQHMADRQGAHPMHLAGPAKSSRI